MQLGTTLTCLACASIQQNPTGLRCLQKLSLTGHLTLCRRNWIHRSSWPTVSPSPVEGRRVFCTRAAADTPTDDAPATAAVPLLLAQSYFALQHPAVLNIRYSQAVKEFAEAAVTAYECGYAEDTLREELEQATEQPGIAEYVKTIDKEDCLLCVCMVWMTLTMAKSTRRWSTAKPVSDATLASWKGFVTLIVNGYMKQRLAWFPIDRLQMEVTAVTGRTERPHDVAEWARIVQTTLTQVAPQFPSQ